LWFLYIVVSLILVLSLLISLQQGAIMATVQECLDSITTANTAITDLAAKVEAIPPGSGIQPSDLDAIKSGIDGLTTAANAIVVP